MRVPAALIGSGSAGLLVGTQSRINGGLGQELGNGYVAAAFSFSVGLLIMLVFVLCSANARKGLGRLKTEVRAGRFPVWGLFGGLCGAFFVLTQGLVAATLGLALFTVGIVAGQVVGGLVLDRIGLGPGGRVDPTPTRLLGTVLAILAVAVSVASSFGQGGSPWLIALPLLAGVGVAWQSAVNGLSRAAAQSAAAATFVNFVIGSAALIAAAGISVALQGWPEHWPSNPLLYVGGPIGVTFIIIAAALVRTAGVLLLSMSNVAGQLLASVLSETVIPIGAGLTPWLVAGAGIGLVAVVVAAIPSGKQRG